MKKIAIAAVVATLAFSGQAFAQAQNFAGFQVGATLDSVASRTEGLSSSWADAGVNASLFAQQNFELSGNWLLGVGASYQLGENPAGSDSSGQFKTKGVYSLYVAPGVVFGGRNFVYGKLAYVGADSKFVATSGTTTAASITGTSFGAGWQMPISQNLFFGAELMVTKYGTYKFCSSCADAKSNSATASASISYKF